MDNEDTRKPVDSTFDEAAQYDDAWVMWAHDDAITEKVDAFFNSTLPSVPQRPWWVEQGLGREDDVWVPMPDCGRYDFEMLDWISAMAFEYFFPDEESLSDATNFEVADQVVAYLTRCFREHLGGGLFNAPGTGGPLYEDIGPAVLLVFAEHPVYLVDELLEAAREGFSSVSRRIAALASDKKHDEQVFGG